MRVMFEIAGCCALPIKKSWKGPSAKSASWRRQTSATSRALEAERDLVNRVLRISPTGDISFEAIGA
jgi:hypothetical protein